MCNENTTLLEFTHCHPLEALKAMYCMSYIFIDRVWTNRARLCFPEGATFTLGEEWVKFFTTIAQGLGDLGVGDASKFSFEEPQHGGTHPSAWRLPDNYWAQVSVEATKGQIITLLCGIARAMMHEHARGRFTLEGVKPRGLGRLVKWCQVQLGETYYMTEKYAKHHRPRARGWARDEREPTEGEVNDVNIRPYDPRYAPPAPVQPQVPPQAQQAPPQAPHVPQAPPQDVPHAPQEEAPQVPQEQAQEVPHAPPQAQEGEAAEAVHEEPIRQVGGEELEAAEVLAGLGQQGAAAAGASTSAEPRRSQRLKDSPPKKSPIEARGKGKKSKLPDFSVPTSRVRLVGQDIATFC